MPFNLPIILSFVIFFWLLLLTFFLWKTISHYNNLTKNVKNKQLTEILEELLQVVHVDKKDIEKLQERCDTIEKDGSFHIQKVGLLRFNPFKDTGGDQSFILSLLDGNNTGVIISGLYSRSGTRWYAKKILAGKGLEHELSEDEKKALASAKGLQ